MTMVSDHGHKPPGRDCRRSVQSALSAACFVTGLNGIFTVQSTCQTGEKYAPCSVLGTPTGATGDQFARTKITNALQAKFPNIAVQDCSAWGAKTIDFLGGNNQIGACFPSVPDQRKTLTVIIM